MRIGSTHYNDAWQVEFVGHSGYVFESIHQSSVSGTHLGTQGGWPGGREGGIHTHTLSIHTDNVKGGDMPLRFHILYQQSVRYGGDNDLTMTELVTSPLRRKETL